MIYDKICDYCNSKYVAKGPAGRYCVECSKLSKYVRVQKGITYNVIKNSYKISFKRDSCGSLTEFTNSLDKAIDIFNNWDLFHMKESNTGIMNNACRGGLIGNQHNFRLKKLELKSKLLFTCNRCNKEYKTSIYLNLHHIDHNRDNDKELNFEVLCVYCHRKHHNKDSIHKHLYQGSTTIPRGSTLQVNGSGSGVNDNKSL